ncbi:uncharacterized protein LOC111795761 [Cucurbita pepo subsp. pepo]|uniref:uncharacterized protein LOC111795761 n=1 Tax=Cucurbita pepo subsp. pepo TaxID=3664 RepID=UPI000C9D3041|nr:uncharacterized protein LOC111795761 [Cucurbita pepo subsp. pepo]XP_023534100.1 uncharacterized protein LOC111795761 [Cucurbita pepo subsp. pepo]
MDMSNSSSVRVLVRPPPISTSTSSSASQTPLPSRTASPDPSTSLAPSSPSPSLSVARFSDGIVVVGFIGRRPDDSIQLINRVIDSNVFGSGKLDKKLDVEKEEVRDWFKRRRISYHHEEERGILFLQFSSHRGSVFDAEIDYDSAIEEHDFGDLQGMLFMFSVCHVIIYIQEGLRFDTNILKKFRALQSAKHVLTPFIKSRATPPLPSRLHSSSASRSVGSAAVSNNSSPIRSGSILTRNASGISVMSGLGSYTSLFPGQCTPVILFIFIDDFSDGPLASSNVEAIDTISINQSPSSDSMSRPNLPVKGSGSVVVLARPVSKSEGGFRKKLQSSLETQIRFLIKKCRTLSGSETSHAGSRGGSASSSAPLFSLDSSKAVVLVDKSANRTAESLDFATSLVEDVLNGKATSDSLLLESHGQSASREDIVSLREFIYRQSDILRGRGGLVHSTSSGSAGGVGMVAVAAAAAAASAASGKAFTTPELPSMEIWLSSSQQILQGILCAKGGCIDEVEISKRKPRHRHIPSALIEGNALKGLDPLDIAVSWLESGKGLNMKFSTSWSERALPAAKEVYLRDLPACYPTSQHEAHLEKALLAFHSMVKGPAVQHFAKRLEEECKSIWNSGRQLCDAVSLTGKPCMHQRHSTENGDSPSEAMQKTHSSGYVFLHACACGRSRRLRSDPFDFEAANVTFNRFADCDNFLPVFQLPGVSVTGPIQPSSWSLIRVGGAKYYEPSKGLLQSGFYPTQKFLFKWKINTRIRKTPNDLTENIMLHGSLVKSFMDSKVEPNVNVNLKRADVAQLKSGDSQPGIDNERNSSENIAEDKKSISGRGLPNFTLRKPFSEVVAGSSGPDVGFSPLQQRIHSSPGMDKGIKQNKDVNNYERGCVTVDNRGFKNSENIISLSKKSVEISGNEHSDSDSFLRIGTNVVPMNVNSLEKTKNTLLKQTLIYIGFEHECPHGHRFLLNPEHLKELGSSYATIKKSHTPVQGAACNLAGPQRYGKSDCHGKSHDSVSSANATFSSKERNLDKLKDAVSGGSMYSDDQSNCTRRMTSNNLTSVSATVSNSVKDLEKGVKYIGIEDNGSGFFMLNRDLPIFMNCPHCKLSKNEKDPPNVKFSGTISQLQRIFVVTPPFPTVLATHPVIQFEESCLPPSVPGRQQKLQFALGCQVVLPPESFLTLRLPFVYGVQLDDGSLLHLNPLQHQPEATAWIIGGTTLQILSKCGSLDEGFQT